MDGKDAFFISCLCLRYERKKERAWMQLRSSELLQRRVSLQEMGGLSVSVPCGHLGTPFWCQPQRSWSLFIIKAANLCLCTSYTFCSLFFLSPSSFQKELFILPASISQSSFTPDSGMKAHPCDWAHEWTTGLPSPLWLLKWGNARKASNSL